MTFAGTRRAFLYIRFCMLFAFSRQVTAAVATANCPRVLGTKYLELPLDTAAATAAAVKYHPGVMYVRRKRPIFALMLEYTYRVSRTAVVNRAPVPPQSPPPPPPQRSRPQQRRTSRTRGHRYLHSGQEGRVASCKKTHQRLLHRCLKCLLSRRYV